MKKLLLLSCVEKFYPKMNKVFGGDLNNMNVLCIPTAAYVEDNHEWLWAEINTIKNNVKFFKELDIAESNEEDLENALKGIDIIYVTGGNTYFLLDHLKKCNFSKLLDDHFKKGGWYIGASAGAIVTSQNISFIGDLDPIDKANLSDYNGLNWVDFSIMPHMDGEYFSKKILRLMPSLVKNNNTIIGLNDDQGVLVKDSFIQIL